MDDVGEPIGTVAECRRYPVKSLQGLVADRLDVGTDGVEGDRRHALVDPDGGHLLSAKRTSALLQASADDAAITLPGGTIVRFDAPDADGLLSAWLGRPVHLAGIDEAGERSFEMTFDPPNDDAEYYEIPAATGTFLDSHAVHLVTTATLDHVRSQRPDLDWDVRRFRPNLVLDVDGPPFIEQEWLGIQVRIGAAVLSVDSPTVRCAMPLRAQPGGLDREPALFKAMSDLNETFPNHLGVYCSVVTPGPVSVADGVWLG